ncbi:MAG: hypothetical protein E8A46_04110 [Bradyrhizobium sp.]|jgi:hypothetical protein|uniref:hypothetical protein n=1 Tax=Bradyrhizobium sp. TaxID=376 RepID=UPI00120A1E87|nr:hypothetical protein [Bradyrhizobium sp.]THD56209.1 MAG: hypothetical protein E8A46_04110 [Bradyrhizobium sp.]
MPKIASILACCAVASMVSLAAQALPGSPAPTQVPASEVIMVSSPCWDGFHRSRATGRCVSDGVTYAGPQAFGLPYVELPSVRLPYAELPVRLPYIEPPAVRLPYAELPVRLPYVEPPAVRLPYAELPVRLPYVEPPAVGLPYVELPVLGTSPVCPNGYSYYPAYRRCAPLYGERLITK